MQPRLATEDPRSPLRSLSIQDITTIVSLLQDNHFEQIEDLLWFQVNQLQPRALSELCALLWIGRDGSNLSTWQSKLDEARGIHPCYVFEKLSNEHYLQRGLQELELAKRETASAPLLNAA